MLGSAHLWSGRTTEAVRLLEEGVEAITAMRIPGYRLFFIRSLSEAYLVVGRIAEAREHAQQAVSVTRTHQARSWEAWGLKLLGDVHAQELAESEQAEDAYRQAIALAIGLGLRPLIAHCHFGLGTLHAGTGQREEAKQHLAIATTLYREMDMRCWLEQAESALGPSHGNPP